MCVYIPTYCCNKVNVLLVYKYVCFTHYHRSHSLWQCNNGSWCLQVRYIVIFTLPCSFLFLTVSPLTYLSALQLFIITPVCPLFSGWQILRILFLDYLMWIATSHTCMTSGKYRSVVSSISTIRTISNSLSWILSNELNREVPLWTAHFRNIIFDLLVMSAISYGTIVFLFQFSYCFTSLQRQKLFTTLVTCYTRCVVVTC